MWSEKVREMSCIAVYKMPGAPNCVYLQSEQSAFACMSLDGVSDKSGFLIAPFECDAQCPMLLIQSDRVEHFADANAVYTHKREDVKRICKSNYKRGLRSTQRGEYDEDFAKFHEMLQSGRLGKIVLSRMESLSKQETEDVCRMFADACINYPRCYVALFSAEASGTWLIASPELLLSVAGEQAHTIALAGTMTAESYAGDASWSEKNRDEQRIVSEYIIDRIKAYSTSMNVSAPYTAHAASLVHLRTDIDFTLSAGVRTTHLLSALHPTPAVCGVPAAEAFGLLTNEEHCPRLYYSGYSGPYNINGVTSQYVSLRCMQICRDVYNLYAGGGILAASTSDSEWSETEAKMRVIKNIIDNAK